VGLFQERRPALQGLRLFSLFSSARYFQESITTPDLTSECDVWHHDLMRTTLSLEGDAIKAIQAYAKSRRLPLGKAASELVRRGARYQVRTRKVNGLPVLDAPDDFPVITSERVRELCDEE
jgi:hypothetical protein